MKKTNQIQEKIKLFSSSTPPKIPRNENHHPLTKPEETSLGPPPEPTRLGPTPEPTRSKEEPTNLNLSLNTDSEASQETKHLKPTVKTNHPGPRTTQNLMELLKQPKEKSMPKTRARNPKTKAENSSLDQPDIKLLLANKKVEYGAKVAADPNNSHHNRIKSENNSATRSYNYSLGKTSLNAPANPNNCRAASGKPGDVKPTVIGQNSEKKKKLTNQI